MTHTIPAAISLVSMTLDGLLTLMDWSNPAFTSKLQIADAALTAIYTLVQIYPLALVCFALRKRLDASRRADLNLTVTHTLLVAAHFKQPEYLRISASQLQWRSIIPTIWPTLTVAHAD
jgi:hypothetical protein